MRKITVITAVFVLGLLTSLSAGVHTVNAQYTSVDVQVTYGSLAKPIYVNQRLEFTATCSGGAPPYTYQWYTQLWPTWKPGMSYHLAPLGSEIAVPDATSSKFEFVESTAGTYSITLRTIDSAGDSTYHAFLPGLWVFVLPLPTPPNISILNPENRTYTTNEIPLNSTVSKPAEWIGYSIDGQANITVSGNTTLTALPNGAHNLTVYANDTDGLLASGTIYFSIAVPSQDPTSNPEIQPQTMQTPWPIVIVLIAAVIGTGIAISYGKRTRK